MLAVLVAHQAEPQNGNYPNQQPALSSCGSRPRSGGPSSTTTSGLRTCWKLRGKADASNECRPSHYLPFGVRVAELHLIQFISKSFSDFTHLAPPGSTSGTSSGTSDRGSRRLGRGYGGYDCSLDASPSSKSRASDQILVLALNRFSEVALLVNDLGKMLLLLLLLHPHESHGPRPRASRASAPRTVRKPLELRGVRGSRERRAGTAHHSTETEQMPAMAPR